MTYRVEGMSDVPGLQVGQTLGIMRQRAAEDAEVLKPRAMALTAGASSTQDKINALYYHTKNNIHFQRDEVTGGGVGGWDEAEVIETIIRPREMAKFIDQGVAVGDCDDFSMYLASLLTACGIRCEFTTVAADGRVPDQFSHVYVTAFDEEGGHVPLDASHGEYPGWEVPNQFGLIKGWPVCGGGFFSGFLSTMAAAFAAVWLWDRFKGTGRVAA